LLPDEEVGAVNGGVGVALNSHYGPFDDAVYPPADPAEDLRTGSSRD
jgi:hypothetical protein